MVTEDVTSNREYSRLSIVVPVYNESATILPLLERVNAVNLEHFGLEREIIVVDDGSTDGSVSLLEGNGELYSRLIKKENGGKGSAVRTGLQHTTGDIIIIQDADLEYTPNDYMLLLYPILQGMCKVTYGSRFMGTTTSARERFSIPVHYFGNRLLSLYTGALFFTWISDMETCYKCFTRDVLAELNLKQDDFRIEPEITIQILKNGLRIIELPIQYRSRSYAEGKKIHWVDGLRAIWFLTISRFTPREELLEPLLRAWRTKVITRYLDRETRLLDVGCGFSGEFLKKVRARIGSGVGIDRKVCHLDDGRIRLINLTFDRELSFKDDEFGVVTMFAVIEHLDHPGDIVREVHRVLRPGGMLIITTPSPRAEPLLKLLATLHLVSPEEIEDHKHYFSQEELRAILKDAGFGIVDTSSFELGMNTLIVGKKAE